MTRQEQVREFMLRAGQDCPDKPTLSTPKVRELRVKLIAEELMELASALGVSLIIHTGGNGRVDICIVECENELCDIVEAYDAMLDIEVVTTGSAVAFGLDTESGWQEVHRSNMSKFIDGHRREDGKWVKGPSYSPAKLAPIIEEMKIHDEKYTPTGE